MKTTTNFVLAAILVFGTSLAAQEGYQVDRAEVFLGYSYLSFSPTITGLSSRSFDGGGVGLQLNFLKILGIKGEIMGYGNTTFTRTVGAVTYHASANMYTYMAGPVIRIPIWRVTPFGEILFGASHTNGYVNLSNAIAAGGVVIPTTPTQNPFTMAVGGGLDVAISTHFAIRPGEFNYLLTRYTNPLTSTNNQNNFRYCGGLIFKF